MRFSEGFINLTPHEIILVENVESFDAGNFMRVPSIGIASVLEKTHDAGSIYGTPFKTKTYAGIEGLPKPSPGTYFLVSIMVFERTDRIDVICPDTGQGAVRGKDGKLIGTKWFLRK